MWLNNYYMLRAVQNIIPATVGSSSDKTLTVPTYYDTTGKQQTTFSFNTSAYSYSNGQIAYILNGGFYSGVLDQTSNELYISSTYKLPVLNFMIGTGATPATADDYKMEAQITSGHSVTATQDYIIEEGILRRHATVTNTGTNTLTITEIGISAQLRYTGSSMGGQVLIYRDVLAEPIVLEAGESFTFTLTDTFTMPA